MDSGYSIQSLIDFINPVEVYNVGSQRLHYTAVHPDGIGNMGCLYGFIDEYLEYNRWFSSRDFIQAVIKKKPTAVIVSEFIEGFEIPQLVVNKPREAIARATWYLSGRPDKSLKLIGVTGTNGKTTTSKLISHLINSFGVSSASLGTLGLEKGSFKIEDGLYTTPLAPDLNRIFNQLIADKVNYLAMETSSHALALGRVHGLHFSGAVLTQFTRDHLDFHGTEEAYLASKLKLFNSLGSSVPAVINRGSKFYQEFFDQNTGRLVSYSTHEDQEADYQAIDIEVSSKHSAFRLKTLDGIYPIQSPLVGLFQIENILAAIALVHTLGFSMKSIVDGVQSFDKVPGRMEKHKLPNKSVAVIDYAHNPDGLENLLKNCRLINKGKLKIIFGCGGDRDQGKRPLMGKIAGDLADEVYLTSDNPRTEDPDQILNQIEKGVKRSKTTKWKRIVDRKTAIETAYADSGSEDLIVIAGKGHETYQIVGLEKKSYSDQAVLNALQSNVL